MKTLLFIISFLITYSIQAQTWSWSSENPKAGEDLVVTLRDIDRDEDIHIVGYYFQGKDLVTSDINYIVENGALKMTLKVPESNWLRLVVKDNENEVIAGDHRDVLLTGAPANSSLVDFANATAAYYRLMGLNREPSEVTLMYRNAIATYPAWLHNPSVLRSYYNMSKAAASEEDLKSIRNYISECEASTDPVTEEILISAMSIAKETGDTILYKSLRKKLDESYPNSLVKQNEQRELFAKANTLADKIILRDQFRAAYPVNEFNRGIHDQMTAALVQECVQKEDWEKVEDYVNEILDPSTKASVCNNYAWTLAGEGLENEATQIELASNLSSTSLSLLTPDIKKPATMSQSEWERSLEYSKAMYGDTYALILYKQGKYDDALAQQVKAIKAYNYNDVDMNDRYAVYLEKAGRQAEALSFIEDMIIMGKSSSAMKETHERLWKSKTMDQLYDSYIMQLESVAKEKRIAEIKSGWMDAASIPFTLKNLDGNTVSLADYKGKTVVLDFWATWCGPCKASFPGMKNAVEHYAADKDVVFLFIDTWETGDNVHDKVRKFITDNKYPFHVLMDNADVVTKYKVDGIPTKFIIGPDQKIRFKSTGYGGNNDVLVEELITMIDLARQM